MKHKFLIFIFFFYLSLNKTSSNELIKNIQIVHADLIQNNKHNQDFILTGDVHLKYGNYHLFCDKIIYNKKNNQYHGYGNVRLLSGKNKITSHNIEGNFYNFQLSGKVFLYKEKMKLTADIINYNFYKQLFQAIGNVTLFFDKIKLKTSILEYNFILNQIFYKKKSVIYYGDYIISSKEGLFYITKKKVELKHEIKLISKNYTVYANTLEYLFEKKKVNFRNTVIIIQNKNLNNFIYAKKAFFFFQEKMFFFENYISIHYNDQIFRGENLIFDQKKKCGFIKNILLEDLKKKFFLISGHGKFDFYSGILVLEKNPKIIKISKNDFIFVFSKILKISIKKNYEYSIQAFSVKSFFLNESIQGKCDLFNYESLNNYIQFSGTPIFWFQNKQITGKVIYIYSKNENYLDYIIIKNALYTEKINSKEFNQIEGNIITGFFNKGNLLKKVVIKGNINSIIFLYYQGKKIIHRLSCRVLSVFLDSNKKIRKILCEKETHSELIPIHKKTPNPKELLYLPKFSWKKKDKPEQNKKLFIKEIDKYKKESLLEKEEIKTMIKNK
ncbi:LptA/OstA family protein [Blattabacterium cuenoti]|uniref:LptA/OstA family protein n=1 Tax=Blattabacterium cuenoti TaxID=1653831 RepID=UPI00163D02BF|nr:LptA/OstA family protein [Blattabacterium cuenoti]